LAFSVTYTQFYNVTYLDPCKTAVIAAFTQTNPGNATRGCNPATVALNPTTYSVTPTVIAWQATGICGPL